MTLGFVGRQRRARRADARSRARATSSSTCCSRAPTQRSAREIAEAIESVGGEMNAFTTHEQTVFYVRVPDAHLELAFDILADVLWRPAFRPDDVESERQVILEEIGMRDDTPDDLVHDLFAARAVPRPSARARGARARETRSTAMPRDDIAALPRAHYQPANVVLAAAGNLDPRRRGRAASRRAVPDATLGAPARGRAPRPRRRSRSRSCDRDDRAGAPRAAACARCPRSTPTATRSRRRTRCSAAACRRGCSRRSASSAASRTPCTRTALRSTTPGSSRSTPAPRPNGSQETLDVIEAELARLVDDGVPDAELDAAKGHLTGSLAMSLETSAAHAPPRPLRARRRRDPELDELVAAVRRGDAADVRRVFDRALRDPTAPSWSSAPCRKPTSSAETLFGRSRGRRASRRARRPGRCRRRPRSSW